MTFTINNNYKVLGLNNSNKAPLIWLIHGAGGDLQHYDIVTPLLIESGFRVLLFDVRFHGLSQPEGDEGAIDNAPFNFEDVIQDMNSIFRQVKDIYYPDNKIELYLGGLSMGGMISLLYASKHENWDRHKVELKGVILLAAGIPYMQVSRPSWELFQTHQEPTPEILEFVKSSIIASSIKNPLEVKRAMELISDNAMYKCLVAISSLYSLPSDSPKEYELLTTVPILLIMPDGDPYTKLEMEKLHEISKLHGVDSEAIVIQDSGHMVIIDQGSQVGVCIKDFVERINK